MTAGRSTTRLAARLAAALVLAGMLGTAPAAAGMPGGGRAWAQDRAPGTVPGGNGDGDGDGDAEPGGDGDAEPPPSITVTPADGAGIGDMLTVTGEGFGTLALARPFVALCASEPVAAGTRFDGRSLELIEPRCAEPLVADVAPDGSFALELPVTTARASLVWAGALDVGPDLLWETAMAPVTLVPPGGQDVRAGLDTAIAYAGQAPRLRATFDRATAAPLALPCSAEVLDEPWSVGAVYAFCDRDAGLDLTVDEVGEVVAELPLPAGTGAVWVGAPAPDSLVGAAVPVTVHEPSMTVTPSAGLVDGQQVTVTLDDLGPAGRGAWAIAQCDAAVLDDLGGDLEWRCAAPRPAGDVDGSGQLALDVTVAAEPGLGPVTGFPTVDCTRAAGACVLVASATFTDGQPPARYATPLTFGPTVPVVMPAAGAVAEGDSGTVTGAVPVTLSGPPATPVTVRWSTFAAPGIAWAAAPGEDYVAASGTLTFAPGETTATIPVEVLGDTVTEEGEMALVGLHDPTGATIGGYAGIGGVAIADDD